MFQHEIDLLRGNLLCGDDEIAFIFAVFIIYDDDKFARFERFDSLFYTI